ncbi:MAG: hypothetical protein EPN85_07285 [Bacteroidetes bacterium]|nr:MAG: hypothetical protein EPN85_07285 [Bacteroidota bacterium]
MTKEKYLVLKGCAGLGNRLMTICNALEYCKRTNRRLIIDWSDGVFAPKGLNVFLKYFRIIDFASLSSLEDVQEGMDGFSFYPPVFKKNIESGGYDHFHHVTTTFFQKIPKRVLFNERLKMLHGFWQDKTRLTPTSAFGFFKEIFVFSNLPFGHDLSRNRTEDVLFYFDFTPNSLKETFLKHVVLQSDIDGRIASYASEHNLNRNTIGVHVRSTDKKPERSLAALYEKIKKLNLRDFQIFLATDNKEVATAVKNMFPKVIEYPKFMPDIKSEGMHLWAKYNDQLQHGERILEESIVDMWLLSKCEYLLFQGNSTFSILSSFMHPNRSKSIDWDQ